jgi:hypothetical protein
MLDDGVMPYVAVAIETAFSIYEKNGEMPDGFLLEDGTVAVNAGHLATKVDAENLTAGYNKTSPKKMAQLLQDSFGAIPHRKKAQRKWVLDPTRVLSLLYLHDKKATPFEEYLADRGDQDIIEAANKASL